MSRSSTSPPQPPPSATATREMSLGQHVLILLGDQSIELLCCREAEPAAVQMVLCLERCEAYRLLIALQEMFKAKGS